MRTIPDEVERVVAEVALGMEKDAKMEAPVDTGYLRSSITSSKVGPAEWEVRAGADYASFVNFGTRHMAPRPFFTHAAERALGHLVTGIRGLRIT
jgi:HK97 gp10 family phage protein